MAGTMFSSPIFCLLFVLSIFQGSVLAELVRVERLQPRQVDTATDPLCQNYAKVANLTTIGLNSTYRAAFLASTSLGTDTATSILDTQTPLLPAMTRDATLNERCGNLTTVALQGAATNLTNGLVLDLAIKAPAGVGVDGLHVPIIVIAICIVMCGTFMTL
jgi:hypothetical protein